MQPKIDVHAHFLPPAYRDACLANGHATPDGMPSLPEWSEEAHIRLMDESGIEKSILSISTPGTHLRFGQGELAAKVTRECNLYAADLKRRRPDRFGYWASLPIPDVQLCLDEIARCAAEGCDGYVLLTNGHGHYLGDQILDPVFEELNRRKATVFIHPTTPCVKCPLQTSPATQPLEAQPTRATPFEGRYPNPVLEFFFDTARVVSNLFLSGTVQRCPDLKFILPHLGGASPPLLSRWTGFSTLMPGPWESVDEKRVREIFNRQFWFDLAGFPFPGQLIGLMQGSGISHSRLLYGSDFPYTGASGVQHLSNKLDEGANELFSEDEIKSIYFGNAESLLDK